MLFKCPLANVAQDQAHAYNNHNSHGEYLLRYSTKLSDKVLRDMSEKINIRKISLK